MEQLHNLITATIVRHLNTKKIEVADAVLVLEMIKQDLVKQVLETSYKQPVTIVEKVKNGRIQKNNSSR